MEWCGGSAEALNQFKTQQKNTTLAFYSVQTLQYSPTLYCTCEYVYITAANSECWDLPHNNSFSIFYTVFYKSYSSKLRWLCFVWLYDDWWILNRFSDVRGISRRDLVSFHPICFSLIKAWILETINLIWNFSLQSN